MKKIFLSLLTFLILASCTKDTKGSMLVTGKVKGLKKGTLYLQKMSDTLIVTVDSIALDGVNVFSLSDELESPEVYFLSLGSNADNRIPFFGDKGTIEINTKVDKFVYGALVKGLKNQGLLDEYNAMKSKFSNKNLDLIKAEFDAKKVKNTVKMDSVQNLIENLTKSRYRYTVNFAINNGDAEVAPYLALTELYNANVVWLDSLNNSLSKDVSASKYGKKLKEFIADIKSKE